MVAMETKDIEIRDVNRGGPVVMCTSHVGFTRISASGSVVLDAEGLLTLGEWAFDRRSELLEAEAERKRKEEAKAREIKIRLEGGATICAGTHGRWIAFGACDEEDEIQMYLVPSQALELAQWLTQAAEKLAKEGV